MDFASLPPEINSARMYAGPGSGPLLAAAAAWEGLSVDLQSTASLYQSVITSLTSGPWLGPAAESMVSAATPYVAWLRNTAATAEQTATQATAAAAAYEDAFAETVPPPVVEANRLLLAALVSTNIFGQNTAAIAATETQYAEMWAQDAEAMLGYAGATSSATTLTPFAEPSSTTDPGGQAAQAAATAQSAAIPIQQTFSSIPNTLGNLASPAAALSPLDLLGLLSDLSGLFVDPELSAAGLAVDSTVGISALPFDVGGYFAGLHTDGIVSGWAGVESWPGTGAVPPTPFPVITNLAGGSVGSPVTASMGAAKMMSGLSVPQGWATVAPEIRPLAMAFPITGPTTSVGATASGSPEGAGNLFGQMAVASMAGRALAGTTGSARRERERVGAPTAPVAEQQPTAPSDPPPVRTGGPITSIAAELRELASLRDAGILTDAEFTEQKQRLLPH